MVNVRSLMVVIEVEKNKCLVKLGKVKEVPMIFLVFEGILWEIF